MLYLYFSIAHRRWMDIFQWHVKLNFPLVAVAFSAALFGVRPFRERTPAVIGPNSQSSIPHP